jgi:hypothetical protein
LPVEDGRGACSGISMWRTLSLMVVFMGWNGLFWL